MKIALLLIMAYSLFGCSSPTANRFVAEKEGSLFLSARGQPTGYIVAFFHDGSCIEFACSRPVEDLPLGWEVRQQLGGSVWTIDAGEIVIASGAGGFRRFKIKKTGAGLLLVADAASRGWILHQEPIQSTTDKRPGCARSCLTSIVGKE